MSERVARLTGRGVHRFRTGHPWIYQSDVESVEAGNGDLVALEAPDRRRLGHAFWSEHSKIALRVALWGDADAPPLDELFSMRIAAACERRKPLEADADCMRLVSAEADGLPGLLVDRYADVLVVAALVPAMEDNLTRIVPPLVERFAPRMVLARHDAPVRDLERLPREVRVLHGKVVEEVAVAELGLDWLVRPFTGQKTGLYLDQRNARRRVRELVRPGWRVLDLCCFVGGFALNALRGGAREVVAVDQSEEALAAARAHAQRNQLAGLVTRAGNVFDVARELVAEGETFDLVVLDPPAFAKSRREVEGAVRGYLDLNRRAMELVRPGGLLVTCSCSHHVTESLFLDILREASARTDRRALVLERVPPGLDHPVLLTLPESEYLKVFVLGLS